MFENRLRRRRWCAVLSATGITAIAAGGGLLLTASPGLAAGNGNANGNGANPPGNNGIVKVGGLDLDAHPNQDPHPGKEFRVEFYNFDEDAGSATVTFSMQAPTQSVALLGGGPFSVPLSDSPADGSLDGSGTYSLSFDGEPHPVQGYHVELGVQVAGSGPQGLSKSKTFWVDAGALETEPSAPDKTEPTEPEETEPSELKETEPTQPDKTAPTQPEETESETPTDRETGRPSTDTESETPSTSGNDPGNDPGKGPGKGADNGPDEDPDGRSNEGPDNHPGNNPDNKSGSGDDTRTRSQGSGSSSGGSVTTPAAIPTAVDAGLVGHTPARGSLVAAWALMGAGAALLAAGGAFATRRDGAHQV